MNMLKPPPHTEDSADLEFLTKYFRPPQFSFAIPVGSRLTEDHLHAAHSRAVHNGYIQLIDIDVIMIPLVPGQPPTPVNHRVFKLMFPGEARLQKLRTSAH